MANREPLVDENGEIREITAEDVVHFKPFSALPEKERKILLKLQERAPQKSPKVET